MHKVIRNLIVVVFATGALAAPVRAGCLDRAETWNADRAAHLLRRAGFGGTPEDAERLTVMGLDGAVAHLVDYEHIEQSDPDFQSSHVRPLGPWLNGMEHLTRDDKQKLRMKFHVLGRFQIQHLRAWWLRRMVETPRPFEEKMTLFWHGHFTTGFEEVQSDQRIIAQHHMLRQRAVGPFGDLLRAVARDPAMMVYLNTAQNRKEHPNENFARELLELFTMGAGNYTETDVTEAARALTGWGVDEHGFRFRRQHHDQGEKTIFGQTGPFDGDDVLDLILEQPATTRHLAERLCRFFVAPEPTERMIAALAAKLRETHYDIRETMRMLFTSEAFYGAQVRGKHIKSPVELVVGTLRMLGPGEIDYWAVNKLVAGMGQQLYQPPNVKGWDGDRAWITATTLFGRYAFADGLIKGMPEQAFKRRGKRFDEVLQIMDELRVFEKDFAGLWIAPLQVPNVRQKPLDVGILHTGKTQWRVYEIVDRAVKLLLPVEISRKQRSDLIAIFGTANQRVIVRRPEIRRKIERLLYRIMVMAEYQVS